MNDVFPPFDESELSSDDLDVLRAFDAMDGWDSTPAPDPANNAHSGTSTLDQPASLTSTTPDSGQFTDDDFLNEMLAIFATEADEDIGKMRRTLNQLEQDEQIKPARFVALQRAGHKLRGTAGAVECQTMATVAHHIEVIAEQVTAGQIFPVIGGNALEQAVSVLELLLKNVITYGVEQEGEALLAALATVYQTLNIDLDRMLTLPPAQSSDQIRELEGETAESASITAANEDAVNEDEDEDEKGVSVPFSAQRIRDTTSNKPFIRVDARRFEHLIQHSEHLAELRATLEDAQADVEKALEELHAAQARLQQLEPLFPTLLARTSPSPDKRHRHASSSLVARILNEANLRNTPVRQRRLKARTSLANTSNLSTWDELEMDRYTEKDILLRSLSEAIADVTVCASRVRVAYGRLNLLLQEYVSQGAAVRSDTQLLRLAPLSTLVPRLQRAIAMSALAQGEAVQFEVSGEATEIDEEILEALAKPLLQLLRTCISDAHSTQEDTAQGSYRVWLNAQGLGNEITIEIGFSMTVQGGAVAAIREPIQQLNGTISSRRNAAGGVSFYLHFPRSHGAAQCWLIRAGSQHLIVPVSQVRRISERLREKLDIFYHLREMLNFPDQDAPSESRIPPVLVLAPGAGASRTTIGIAVDEVLGEVELVVKPLKSYLQRPGIAGATVDGKGRVLLMLDLPELVRHYTLTEASRQAANSATPSSTIAMEQPEATKILIADDSVYLRQSLQQTLRHAHYTVLEARDGMEALEQLLENRPHAFLLDVEMPNLNGYDLLSIMQLYPELASVRIIMLTSRASEKHRQRARELGAHAYLTKPCDQETLLQTIREQLTR